MKKIIGIISASLLMLNAFAQDPSYEDLTGGLNTITTAVPFLLIAPDSKAGAMGDVGVATPPDANSLHGILQNMLLWMMIWVFQYLMFLG